MRAQTEGSFYIQLGLSTLCLNFNQTFDDINIYHKMKFLAKINVNSQQKKESRNRTNILMTFYFSLYNSRLMKKSEIFLLKNDASLLLILTCLR